MVSLGALRGLDVAPGVRRHPRLPGGTRPLLCYSLGRLPEGGHHVAQLVVQRPRRLRRRELAEVALEALGDVGVGQRILVELPGGRLTARRLVEVDEHLRLHDAVIVLRREPKIDVIPHPHPLREPAKALRDQDVVQPRPPVALGEGGRLRGEGVEGHEPVVRGHLAHALAWEVELLRIGPAYEIGVPGALSHCGVEVGEHDHLRVGLRVRQHLVQVGEVGVDVLGWCLGIGPMGHDDGKGDPGGSIPGMPMGNQEGGGKLMDLQVEAP